MSECVQNKTTTTTTSESCAEQHRKEVQEKTEEEKEEKSGGIPKRKRIELNLTHDSHARAHERCY